MSAYLIAEIDIKNASEYEDYKKFATDTLKPFEGKYIVRGGQTETLEGNWIPKRIVILEFPDLQKAKDWWSSEEYAQAKSIRHSCAESRMILVNGI